MQSRNKRLGMFRHLGKAFIDKPNFQFLANDTDKYL
uniref:Uncharacterized protein n=1 Tax=Anguilla anguilla TaxID=7936 RepID=A0A0E9VKN3_ANGAN